MASADALKCLRELQARDGKVNVLCGCQWLFQGGSRGAVPMQHSLLSLPEAFCTRLCLRRCALTVTRRTHRFVLFSVGQAARACAEPMPGRENPPLVHVGRPATWPAVAVLAATLLAVAVHAAASGSH